MKSLLLYACCLLALAAQPATATLDLRAVAAQAASNIAARVAGAIAARTNAVRALATPENYALLKSSKVKDAAKKLALQKQLAEAALLDEEQTEAGRLKWHGRYTSEKIDMEKLTATFTHEDGTEYTVKFQTPNLVAKVKADNARLPQPPMTNGVPRALAEARLRRHGERTTKEVTVDVTATRGERPNE